MSEKEKDSVLRAELINQFTDKDLKSKVETLDLSTDLIKTLLSMAPENHRAAINLLASGKDSYELVRQLEESSTEAYRALLKSRGPRLKICK